MARRTLTANTPAKLRVLGVSLVLASLAWGALAAWTVSQHASAASDAVHVEEPLALAAQQMYEAVSDADLTATTTFLSGPQPPLASLQHYQSDIAQAAADLTRLKSAAGGNTALTAALSDFSAGLPVYTGYVAQAQTEYALGYLLTGGSFMQVASEQAHLVLLPAAKTIYSLQDGALTAASDQATTLPPLIVAAVLAVIIGFVLLRAQRWLARRTHRILNFGLAAASAVLVISVGWLAVTFSVARSDLDTGIGSGSRPAAALAQASIDVQQVRGDEILNLISRSGSTSFPQNFKLVSGQIGPGSGTLLDVAATSGGGQAKDHLTAAASDATAWYADNAQVYSLDSKAAYPAETKLVTGTGAGSSAAGFSKLETDIKAAIDADLNTFSANATAGASAFGPLEAVVIVAALLMAAGCALGIARRLREYQ